MEKFEFKVRVEANSKEHALKILNALFEIKRAVSEEDLMKISDVIKRKPGLVKKLKAFL